jgi:hypothetical protein
VRERRKGKRSEGRDERGRERRRGRNSEAGPGALPELSTDTLRR